MEIANLRVFFLWNCLYFLLLLFIMKNGSCEYIDVTRADHIIIVINVHPTRTISYLTHIRKKCPENSMFSILKSEEAEI